MADSPAQKDQFRTGTMAHAAALRGLNQCVNALLDSGLTAVEVLGLLFAVQKSLSDRASATFRKMAAPPSLIDVPDDEATKALTRRPLPS